MGEVTGISWTDHTFNAWWGCARVSPGCEHCYAETLATVRRKLAIWGVDAERKPMSEAYWRAPVTWNRNAEAAGVRRRVFCSSMADVFELPPERNVQAHAVQTAARERLWKLIGETPWLDWQLLTKRPENVRKLAPWATPGGPGTGPWPGNVWVGTTVEDQKRAEERLAWLVEIPSAVRFVSAEPLLEAIDLENVEPFYVKEARRRAGPFAPSYHLNVLNGHAKGPDEMTDLRVNWVIVGGESGAGARPFALDWARSIVAQCQAAKVACFVKQLGADPIDGTAGCSVQLRDRKGGDLAEWPEDLRVQEFPEVARV